MHSHRTLLAELEHMRAWITKDSPVLMGSPVTHATGMLGAVLAPVTIGQNIHLIDRWGPTRVLDIMIEANVGAGTGAAVFLASVIDHPKFTEDHARRTPRVGLGGAPVPVALGERAANLGITVMRAYGSTEHPSITGSRFDDRAAKRHATDGRAMPGVEIELLDEDGKPVAPGTPGEILSRGPDLCVGYTDHALTERAFDTDGWYRTGDMGVLDDDRFLTKTDRLNDVIIRGGENISAAEVEQVIIPLDQVAEVAVVAGPTSGSASTRARSCGSCPVRRSRSRTSQLSSSESGWRGTSGPRSCTSSRTFRGRRLERYGRSICGRSCGRHRSHGRAIEWRVRYGPGGSE